MNIEDLTYLSEPLFKRLTGVKRREFRIYFHIGGSYG